MGLVMYYSRIREVILDKYIMIYHDLHLSFTGPFPDLFEILTGVCLSTVPFDTLHYRVPLPYID